MRPLRSRIVWCSGGRRPHYGPDATGWRPESSRRRAVWAWHVTIAPSWFDPGEVPAQITPFTILYALHDAVVRAMPGERMGNSLAESWTESPTAWSMSSSCARPALSQWRFLHSRRRDIHLRAL